VKKKKKKKEPVSKFMRRRNLPHYADGGDVKANKPIVVGENGKEVFVPKSKGTVIPQGPILDAYFKNKREKDAAAAVSYERDVEKRTGFKVGGAARRKVEEDAKKYESTKAFMKRRGVSK
jgi:hypothetical protein